MSRAGRRASGRRIATISTNPLLFSAIRSARLRRPFLIVAGRHPDPWIERFIRELESLFRSPQSEGPVSAARVARASVMGLAGAPRVDEEMVQASVYRLISNIKSACGP